MFNSTDQVFRAWVDRLTGEAERQNGRFDLTDYVVVKEIPVFFNTPSVSYDRVLQALRDVRHMLPKHGVAIVDAILDHAG